MLAARQAPDPVAGPGQAALLHDGSTAAVLLELAGSQRVDVVFDGAGGELGATSFGIIARGGRFSDARSRSFVSFGCYHDQY